MRFSSNNLGLGDVPDGRAIASEIQPASSPSEKRRGRSGPVLLRAVPETERGQYVTFADATKRSSHCRIWPEQNPPESLMFVSQ